MIRFPRRYGDLLLDVYGLCHDGKSANDAVFTIRCKTYSLVWNVNTVVNSDKSEKLTPAETGIPGSSLSVVFHD